MTMSKISFASSIVWWTSSSKYCIYVYVPCVEWTKVYWFWSCVPSFIRCLPFFRRVNAFEIFDSSEENKQCNVTFTIIITIISISKEWLFSCTTQLSQVHIQFNWLMFDFIFWGRKNPADHLPRLPKTMTIKIWSFFYSRSHAFYFGLSYVSLWISAAHLEMRMTMANVCLQQNCV